MPAESTALAFEAIEFESCTAHVREFFRQHVTSISLELMRLHVCSQCRAVITVL